MSKTRAPRPVHPKGYKPRRGINWFLVGLMYAFYYWARYNIIAVTAALGTIIDVQAVGQITALGPFVYAFAFLVTGPLTDRHGGRKMILIGALGIIAANVLMGLALQDMLVWHHFLKEPKQIINVLTLLFALNMAFQSFGAVAIIKLNAPWFHISERGGFNGIFGAMIASGLYFAFDISHRIIGFVAVPEGLGSIWWVFYAPAIALGVISVFVFLIVKDRPSDTKRFQDPLTGEVGEGENQKPLSTMEVFKTIYTNKLLRTVGIIGIFTGIIRNAAMNWIPNYAKRPILEHGLGLSKDAPLQAHWGLMLLIAGVIGPMAAGWASDLFFGSKRIPSALGLYGVTILGALGMSFCLNDPGMILMDSGVLFIGVIGAHGMLAGGVSMDFGAKAKATATGLIDGMVYLGNGIQAIVLGLLIQHTTGGYQWLPVVMVIAAIIGFVLCYTIRDAKVAPRTPPAEAKA